jgi:hypothetical protein
LLLCLALLATPAVQAVTVADTLDEALANIAHELAANELVRQRGLLLSDIGFFETTTRVNAPFSQVLRKKLMHMLYAEGMEVMLPGSEQAARAVARAEWEVEGDRLRISVTANMLTDQGPKVAATAQAYARLEATYTPKLVPDSESWGWSVLRQLEEGPRIVSRQTVYVKPIKVATVADPAALGTYIADWLSGAMTQSRLFAPVDAAQTLKSTPTRELRTRGELSSASEEGKETVTSPTTSLTGALVDADAELTGRGYLRDGSVELAIKVRKKNGLVLSSARVHLPKDIFPPDLLRTEEQAPPTFSPAPPLEDEDTAETGLTVEITTTRGEGQAEYHEGEEIEFLLRVNRPAYVNLFDLDSDGNAVLLYPVDVEPHRLEAGKLLVLPEDGMPYNLVVGPPFGKDVVWAVASERPLELPAHLPGEWGRAATLRERLREQGKALGDAFAEAEVVVVTRP